MNTHHTPVEPPTQVQQWTAEDVRAARDAGRHDLISAAFDAGQLDNIIADPGGLGQKPSPSESKKSNPMGPAEAAAFIAAAQMEINQ